MPESSAIKRIILGPSPDIPPAEVFREHQRKLKTLLDSFIREADAQRPDAVRIPIDQSQIQPALADEKQQDVLDETKIKFLIALASCYQLYGCPTHLMDVHMPRVAKGLGLTADFVVFPTHTLMSTVRKRKNGTRKQQTLFFRTSFGLNMYRLQLVDELVRRVSSYASVESFGLSPAEAHLKPLIETGFVSGSPSMNRQPSQPSPDTMNHSPIVAPALLVNTESECPTKDDLKRAILGMASYGPGFYTDSRLLAPCDATPQASLSNLSGIYAILPARSSVGPGQDRETTPSTSVNATAEKLPRAYRQAFARLAVEDGFERLQQIMSMEQLYPVRLRWILMAFAASGCCGLFFDGSWTDIAQSFVLGFVVALLSTFNHNPRFSRLYEFLCGILVSFVVRVMHQTVTPTCYKSVVLSSVIWLLQGINITLALVEILCKKLVPGTVRLFYGFVISATIGFGMDLGTLLFARAFQLERNDAYAASACETARGISPNWYPLFLVVTTVSFNMLLNAHYRQLLPMTAVAIMCYITRYFTGTWLGVHAASVLAAFVTGLCSNLYSRWTGHPALIYDLSGMLLLVPGSMAVTGFYLFLQDASGIGLAVTVLMVALALALGLFLASLILPHKDTNAWFSKLDHQTHLPVSALTF